MMYLRTLLFYTGEALSTIPFFIICVFSMLTPPQRRSKLIASWAYFVTWWLKVTVGLKYELVGMENIPEKPCVFACNHQSTWETITTQTFLPPLAWVLKKELLKIPVFGWGLWASGPIAIDRSDRSSALDQVVKQGIEKIKEGRHVLIFPQGTRQPYKTSGVYKKGAAKLAIAADTAIVPIAHNAGKYWPSDSWWLKPGTIKCIIGAPILTEGKTDIELTQMIQTWVEAQGL